MKIAILIFILLTIPVHAQTWKTVATEGQTVVTTGPVTVQFGTAQNTPATAGYKPCATVGGCWKSLSTTAVGDFVANVGTFGDPIPGTLKVLQVLETSTAQKVTVGGVVVMVPALPAPPVTVTATYKINGAATLTINSDSSFVLSGTGITVVKQ